MNIAQKYVDGLKKAYYENGGKKVTLLFLGSDIEEYPYFLLSAQQMN